MPWRDRCPTCGGPADQDVKGSTYRMWCPKCGHSRDEYATVGGLYLGAAPHEPIPRPETDAENSEHAG